MNMTAPCTLYLVRHGQSTANRDNISGGHKDAPLTQKGEAEALETKAALQGVVFDDVYSSDLQRASKTAELIYGRPVPQSHQLIGLRERSFGKLEGHSADEWHKLNDEYEKKYAHLPLEERWEHDYADYIEGDKELHEHFAASLLEIARQNPAKTVLVGTHGGPLRILLMKMGYASFLTAGAFQNGGYVVLGCDGAEFRLEKVVGVRKSGPASE